MSRAATLRSAKAVLFDIDGTLVDSMAMLVAGLGDAVEQFTGLRPTAEAILATIGTPLTRQAEIFAGKPLSESEIQRFVELALECYEAHSDLEQPFPAALEALRLCFVNGLPTCLVTSRNAIELARFLARFSHTPYVTTSVCSSDVRAPTPAPDSAILACTRLGVRPEEAFFIGDSLFDIRCAQAADVASVAVTYGASPAETLAAEHPDLLFETPEALLAWVHEAVETAPCHAKN